MKFIIIQVWRNVHRGGGKGEEHLHLKQGVGGGGGNHQDIVGTKNYSSQGCH